jgi:hypothetical protein
LEYQTWAPITTVNAAAATAAITNVLCRGVDAIAWYSLEEAKSRTWPS